MNIYSEIIDGVKKSVGGWKALAEKQSIFKEERDVMAKAFSHL